MIILIAIVLATVNLCRAQSPPVAYYTFDLANPLAPAVGATNVSAPGTYAIGTGGKVGKYLDISNGNNTVTAGAYNIGGSNAFTVQMLFKMTYNSQYGLFQPMFQYAGVDASFEYPNIGYKGNYIEMSGLNRKSWQYYLDNQWHHAAFTYNKVTGIKKNLHRWVIGKRIHALAGCRNYISEPATNIVYHTFQCATAYVQGIRG